MIKKIAITLILLSLFFAGTMIAEDPPERYTLDIYVTVHAAYNGNTVEIGYMDINHVIYGPLVQTYDVGVGIHIIHCTIEVWPGQHPAPEWVFAEGWGPYSSHDYDECDASISDPMYLDLWLGVAPNNPPQGD